MIIGVASGGSALTLLEAKKFFVVVEILPEPKKEWRGCMYSTIVLKTKKTKYVTLPSGILVCISVYRSSQTVKIFQAMGKINGFLIT